MGATKVSYKCQVCRGVVGPKVPMTKLVVERVVKGLNGKARREIAREIPVCHGCQTSALTTKRKKPRLQMNVPIDF